MDIRAWLRRNPPAVAVRCYTSSGSEKTVAIDETNAKRWAIAAGTIAAIKPVRIEALNVQGNVMRVSEFDDEDNIGEDGATEQLVAARGFQSDLVVTSKLIGEAYRDGAAATKDAYALAFDKMVDLVTIAFSRLNGLEKAWVGVLNRTAAQNDRALMQLAQASDEDQGDLMQQLMAMAMQNGIAGAKPGPVKANGAAKTNGNGTKQGATPPEKPEA